jgi:hypothetical protein
MSNRSKKNKSIPSKKELTQKENTVDISEKQSVAIAPDDQEFIGVRFNYKTNLFFAALAIYLLLTTLFNINGSSVGAWNKISSQKADPQILLGTPKNIRLDEWASHTPAILSQCNSKVPFSTENYSLGGYKSPLVRHLPVKHFSTLLKPQFWFFFLADTERAFAFYWNIKLVILVGGVFLLLMLLLENNFVVSLFGALWVFFSGYTQWWYASPAMWPPELVGYFALFTTAFIISLVSRRKIVIATASLIFPISFFNFATSLYPPHQVPLTYLSFFIVLGVLLPRFKFVLSELLTNKFRLACIGGSLLLAAGLIFAWYWDVRQTLDALANTVYPGQRRVAGGGISIAQIFNGFWGIFMTEKNFPEIWINVCESSNYLLLFPIPLILMCWKWFTQKKVSALEPALAIYILLILLWQILGFPKPIAQITLFDRVTEIRALLSLGIASIVWTCFSLHQITKEKTIFTWRFRIVIATIMLGCVLLYGLYFNIVTGNFASAYQIVMVCLFATAACLLFISRKPMLFAGLILLPNIYFHGLINPICVGLQPILGNPLYEKIHHIARQEPDSKWIVYSKGYPLIANLAYAAGANVFNGLKYIPNLEAMKELSAKNNDISIYNRYGYITLLPIIGQQISFNLSASSDYYTISVDPENDCWKRLGITYCLLPTEDGLNLMKYKTGIGDK